uniref:Uncharacterized protein n=1 Tax=Meloidogyne enterolobii TaxID=390850 RepID=A0A6V7VAD6_MELEN|nr:unnamed protein product [Meloidogyne enterolobii]
MNVFKKIKNELESLSKMMPIRNSLDKAGKQNLSKILIKLSSHIKDMMDDNFNEGNEKLVQQYKNFKTSIQELIKNISFKLIFGITESFEEIKDSLENQRKEFQNYFTKDSINYIEEGLIKNIQEIKKHLSTNKEYQSFNEEEKIKLIIPSIKIKVEEERMTEVIFKLFLFRVPIWPDRVRKMRQRKMSQYYF